MLKVSVTEPPERGKANKAIIELLAEGLAVAKSQITVLTGKAARQKRLLISGIGPQDVAPMQAVVDHLAKGVSAK